MKKLLIIGGTGLIGLACIRKGLKKKYKVHSVSLKKKIKMKNVRHYNFDYSLSKNFKNIDNKFDFIINAGGYFFNSKKNIKDLSKHYLGLKNLINFCDKKKLKKIIHIGSSLEYEGLKAPLKEEMFCQPKSFYGKIKLKSTNYCLLMSKKKKIPITVIRPFSLFSEYQTRGLVYQLSKIIIKKNRTVLKNIPDSLDLIHLDDLIDAIFKLLLSSNSNGEVINIGSGSPIKVKKLIKLIYEANKLKFSDNIFSQIVLKKSNFYPDVKKIFQIIHWKKKNNLFITLNRIKKNIEMLQ